MMNIRDIQYIETVSAVSAVNLVPYYERRAVQPSFVHEVRIMRCRMIYFSSRYSVNVLMRCPPAADFNRILRICYAYDPVDKSFELVCFR